MRITYLLAHHILTINHIIAFIICVGTIAPLHYWCRPPSDRYPHLICSCLSFYCRPTPGCDCLASSPSPPNSCCRVVPAQSHHINHPTTESPQSSLSLSTSHSPRLLALLFIIANIKRHHPPPPLNVEAQYHLSSRPRRLDLIVGCRVYFLLFNPEQNNLEN